MNFASISFHFFPGGGRVPNKRSRNAAIYVVYARVACGDNPLKIPELGLNIAKLSFTELSGVVSLPFSGVSS
jgi:hypothetical protein